MTDATKNTTTNTSTNAKTSTNTNTTTSTTKWRVLVRVPKRERIQAQIPIRAKRESTPSQKSEAQLDEENNTSFTTQGATDHAHASNAESKYKCEYYNSQIHKDHNYENIDTEADYASC